MNSLLKKEKSKVEVKRGDIFLCDLSPMIGSEQDGVRPVMVIQNNIGNRFSPTVIVAAVTSNINRAMLPTQVSLQAEKFNLPKDSVVLLEQIRTIDKMRLVKKVISAGKDEALMEKVTDAYLIAGGAVDFADVPESTQQSYYMYRIKNVLAMIEDHEYEYKEIKGNSPKNSIGSTVGEYATAFLNTKGGRILYGITNNREVVGFRATPDQIDDILQVIYASLRTIEPPISADHYELEFHPVQDGNSEVIEDLYVLEIVVPPSPSERTVYFYKGKELHIRVKGVKHQLLGTEIVTFIQKKLLE